MEKFKMVETIYEEEQELSKYRIPLTLTNSNSAISALRNVVEAWSKATGLQPDILVHVHGRCFHLHKDPLTLRSRFLKRLLMEAKKKSVYLPSSITAETFALVACFCYTGDIVITPINVVALRVAAELLDITEEDDENLLQLTETYFSDAVSVNGEYAGIIFRSCLVLLPEAEKKGFLVSRCIEALDLANGADDGVSKGLIDVVKSLTVEEFQMITNSMKGRLAGNHDLLYKVVDLFLKEHSNKLTEEQINRICCSIDSNNLSQHLLMQAIQNPRMPLRFIIQTMLVEQLNTRRSISIASADRDRKSHDNCTTMGTIIQRDLALCCTEELKATMEATSSRIISLEHELVYMKKRLCDSEKKREALESTKTESCRFSWENKEDRAEIATTEASALKKPCITSSKNGKSLSRMFSGFKNMFRMSKTT